MVTSLLVGRPCSTTQTTRPPAPGGRPSSARPSARGRRSRCGRAPGRRRSARPAASASMMNGIGNRLPAVRSVRTNPGQMVVTRTPRRADLDAQRLEQVDLPRLGRAVGLGAGDAPVAGDRGDARDDALAALEHLGQHGRRCALLMPTRLTSTWRLKTSVSQSVGAHLLPVAGGQDRPRRAGRAASRTGTRRRTGRPRR